MDTNSLKKAPTQTSLHEQFLEAASSGDLFSILTLRLSPLILINQANPSGNTALIVAAYHGHVGVVKTLLEVPEILINQVDKLFGCSALNWAASNGHLAVVKALCNKTGIEINLRNKKGKTAIDQAFENNHDDIVTFLQSKGAVLSPPAPVIFSEKAKAPKRNRAESLTAPSPKLKARKKPHDR